MTVFKRKLYDKLLEWKSMYAGRYAILVEGAKRVGKSTLVKEFAEKEYKSYLLIDFSEASKDIKECFEDIADLDRFFLRLQTITGVQLINRESVIIFDEVQMYPRARQAIKYLVADGRYDYIGREPTITAVCLTTGPTTTTATAPANCSLGWIPTTPAPPRCKA